MVKATWVQKAVLRARVVSGIVGRGLLPRDSSARSCRRPDPCGRRGRQQCRSPRTESSPGPPSRLLVHAHGGRTEWQPSCQRGRGGGAGAAAAALLRRCCSAAPTRWPAAECADAAQRRLPPSLPPLARPRSRLPEKLEQSAAPGYLTGPDPALRPARLCPREQRRPAVQLAILNGHIATGIQPSARHRSSSYRRLVIEHPARYGVLYPRKDLRRSCA